MVSFKLQGCLRFYFGMCLVGLCWLCHLLHDVTNFELIPLQLCFPRMRSSQLFRHGLHILLSHLPLCVWCVCCVRGSLPIRGGAPQGQGHFPAPVALPQLTHTGTLPLHRCIMRSPVSAPTLGSTVHAEVSLSAATDMAHPRLAGSGIVPVT